MSLSYEFTFTIITLSLIVGFIALCTNPPASDLLRKRATWIVAAMVLAGAMKYPYAGHLFSGLEYEDSYIYAAAARGNISSESNASQPFLTEACSNGTVAACNYYSTYSGHVIGYSAVIAAAAKLFGFDPWLANYVSLSASVLCAGILFITALLINNSLPYAAITAAIFALLPFQNLYSTASVVEPFSSLFLALSFLGYLVCVHYQPRQWRSWRSILAWSGLALVWWATILIKRENALEIALLPIVTGVLLLAERKPLRAIVLRLAPVFCISIALAFFSLAVIDISETIRAEIPDVRGSPFSFSFLPRLLPVFLAALFDWRLFAFLSALLPLALVKILHSENRSPLVLYPVVLFGAYLLIYSLHYRSYWFTRTWEINEFDSYRYLANVIPLYSLIAAAGLQVAWGACQRAFPENITFRKFIAPFICGLAVAFSAAQTASLRIYYREIEDEVRFKSVQSVLNFLRPIDYPYAIVADDVVLFQIFGGSSMYLINMYALSKAHNLVELTQQRNVYYIKKPNHDSPLERERHLNEFQILEKLPKETIFVDPEGRFSVIRLGP